VTSLVEIFSFGNKFQKYKIKDLYFLLHCKYFIEIYYSKQKAFRSEINIGLYKEHFGRFFINISGHTVAYEQGDQVGRILAHCAIVYFGKLF
jgi:hypothetical protein